MSNKKRELIIKSENTKEIFNFIEYSAEYIKEKGLEKCNINFLESECISYRRKLDRYTNVEGDKSLNLFLIELSKIYIKDNKLFEVLVTCFLIKKEKDNNLYSAARYYIGMIFYIKDMLEEAVYNFEKIDKYNDEKIYADAQFSIGKIFINDYRDFKKSREAFIKSEDYYSYESYCYIKICDLGIQGLENDTIDEIINLISKTNKILNILKLDFDDSSKDIVYERKLAHYTSVFVANKLLCESKENSEFSNFRLNTINNVNDPSEGYLLKSILTNECNENYLAPEFIKDLHAFVSCFTFNHDSLNQFRLYGKVDNKEASGVSLVFNRNFFNNSYNRSSESINMNSRQKKKVTSNYAIDRQPIMRCVYIDPKSEYIYLAQRNKLTFFREFGNEKVFNKGSLKLKAEVEWDKYSSLMIEKNEDFKEYYSKLKKSFMTLHKKSKCDLDLEISGINIYMKLLDDILIPLKYVFKHSAFQEEQECRMIYIINSLRKPEVKIEFGEYLYVEYSAEVKKNLSNLYIAPAATKYRPYLEKLLCDTDVKIELSNNPYRHT